MKNPTLLNRVIDQFNHLYIRMRREWIEQRPNGQYTHRRTQQLGRRTTGWLTDREVREHLLGKRTIGIFHPSPSVVLGFDLDFHTDDPTIRQGLTRAFIDDVERQLGPGSCHVWDTTGKGVRVEVFFREPVPWSTLHGLTALILDRPWYDDAPEDLTYSWRHNPHVTVEVRPERPNRGRGVKIPLGIDRRNGRFCAFLDRRTLQPVHDQYGYFLAIQPIDPARIPPAAAATQPTASTSGRHTTARIQSVFADALQGASAEDILERCHRLWERGLEHRGTRHTALLLLAMWRLWMAPETTEAELTALLTAWTERELKERPHLIAHDPHHCLRDARQVATDACRGGYSLALLLHREPYLTASAARALSHIRTSDQRMAFLALFLHRYRFADQTGAFHMAYSQIATLLGWYTTRNGDIRPDNGRVGVAVRALLKHYPELITKIQDPDMEPTPSRTFRRSTRYRIHLPLHEAIQIAWPAPLQPASLTPTLLNEAIAALRVHTTSATHLEANFSPGQAPGPHGPLLRTPFIPTEKVIRQVQVSVAVGDVCRLSPVHLAALLDKPLRAPAGADGGPASSSACSALPAGVEEVAGLRWSQVLLLPTLREAAAGTGGGCSLLVRLCHETLQQASVCAYFALSSSPAPGDPRSSPSEWRLALLSFLAPAAEGSHAALPGACLLLLSPAVLAFLQLVTLLLYRFPPSRWSEWLARTANFGGPP